MKNKRENAEYFAQTLSIFLQNAKENPFKFGLHAKQRGDAVEFPLGDKKNRVEFKYKPGVVSSELKVSKGEGDLEKSVIYKVPVDVKLSKQGRVSGTNFEAWGNYVVGLVDYMKQASKVLNGE